VASNAIERAAVGITAAHGGNFLVLEDRRHVTHGGASLPRVLVRSELVVNGHRMLYTTRRFALRPVKDDGFAFGPWTQPQPLCGHVVRGLYTRTHRVISGADMYSCRR
jgi:hypothetical protein